MVNLKDLSLKQVMAHTARRHYPKEYVAKLPPREALALLLVQEEKYLNWIEDVKIPSSPVTAPYLIEWKGGLMEEVEAIRIAKRMLADRMRLSAKERKALCI
jgi:hypothetical protein